MEASSLVFFLHLAVKYYVMTSKKLPEIGLSNTNMCQETVNVSHGFPFLKSHYGLADLRVIVYHNSGILSIAYHVYRKILWHYLKIIDVEHHAAYTW